MAFIDTDTIGTENRVTVDYPTYENDFQCTAENCRNTCCKGKKRRVEDAVYYKALTIRNPYGEEMRKAMKMHEGEAYIAFNEDRKCPLLTECGRCGILENMDASYMPKLCLNLPVNTITIGDYQQRDLSLICPEAAALLFNRDEEFDSDEKEINVPVDPTARKLAFFEHDYLEELRDLRDRLVAVMSSENLSFTERYELVRKIVTAYCTEAERSPEELLPSFSADEVFDIFSSLPEADEEFKQSTAAAKAAAAEAITDENTLSELDFYMGRLACYLIFRYVIESFYDGDLVFASNIIFRSMQYLYAALMAQYINSGALTPEAVIDVTTLYARTVEESEKNKLYMKSWE